MADYWRFPEREPAFPPVSVKRPRGEFEDAAPHGAAFYPREELHYGERFSWREPEPLGTAVDINRNGVAYATGSEIPGLGGGAVMGVGTPGLGVGGLGMDSNILKAPSGALNGGRPDYFPGQDKQIGRAGVSNIGPEASATLFVEGLPSDCSRREAAHIFRPFVGFKEVRLVRKDSKRPGGDQFILCFVDFVDAKCASVALDALQGYKFDETDRDSETLRLQYARVAAPRSGPRDGFRGGRERDAFLPGPGRFGRQ